jgi:Arc/MetJ family transcription regulator
MSKTLIDVDREMLAQAQQILGTSTLKDTVNGALRDVVRRWAVAEFAALARGGLFDDLLKTEQEQQPCR